MLVLKELKDQLVPQDHKDQLDLKVLLDQRVPQVLKALQVILVPQDHKVQLVILAHQVQVALQVTQAELVHQVQVVLVVQVEPQATHSVVAHLQVA
jgi:hypothetical protein